MAINVNGITSAQTQNTAESPEQKSHVPPASNYGQINNTASSTHNLYHNPNNLLSRLDPVTAQQIIRDARLGKGLEGRVLSLFNNVSSTVPMPPIDLLDEMHKKLMGLHTNGHLKNLMRSFYRRARRDQTTDQSLGTHNNHEGHGDLTEKEKVKRKEGHTINDNTINDVLKESLRQHDTPFQRFLLLSMAVQNTKDDPEFNKAAQAALDNLYKNHGVQIRASVHSLDEAFAYGKNGLEPKKITQFQDIYYQLLQVQSHVQMFAILKECGTVDEFNNITNLMKTSANKDKKALNFPTSDPNTIHNLLSFMNIRTAISSLIKSADKFIFACRLSMSANIKRKLGGHLLVGFHIRNKL